MQPWEIWTYDFPGVGPHPAVILGTELRVRHKPVVNVLMCSTQRATRKPELHEVMLDQAEGLDWETLCKCDFLFGAEKSKLIDRRGTVTLERRRAIGQRVIAGLGLAGL